MNRLEQLHDAHLGLDGYLKIAIAEIKKNSTSLGILFGIFYILVPIVSFAPSFNKLMELRPLFESLEARTTTLTQAQAAEIISSLAGPLSIAIVILSIAFTWLGLATPLLIERSIRGQSATALEVLSASLPKIPAGLVVGFVVSLLIFLSAILFVIPAIYVGVCLAFTTFAISLRGQFIDAISYSYSLVKGQWWKVFIRLLLLGLMIFGVSFLLSLALTPVELVLAPVAPLGVIISNLSLTLVGYLWSIVFIVMFLHLDYVRNPVR